MNKIKDVAIIMDGNGRWAKSRFRPRVWGHVKGASIINSIAQEAEKLQLNSLTLYAFSTENWSRPKSEVTALFKILFKFLSKNQKVMIDRNVQFNVIGEYDQLDQKIKNLIEDTKKITKNNSGLRLNFAFGYGGKDEIISSVNKFIENNPGEKISKEDLDQNLYDPNLKEVDLVIRTGGDQRISNFLIWQAAYSELAFTQTKWPDFSREEFCEIVRSYENVERRFGGLGDNSSLADSQRKSQKNKSELV